MGSTTTRQEPWSETFVALGFGIATGELTRIAAPWIPGSWWAAGACAAILLGTASLAWGRRHEPLLFWFSTAILWLFGGRIVVTAIANVGNPPEWDFQVFWLDAKALIAGANIYKGDEVLAIARPFAPSAELARNLASLYPPPTFCVLAPLGFFELSTAYLLWYLANTAALLACVRVAWKCFLADFGIAGHAMAAAFLVLLRPTLETVALGQTNFLVLLCVLLAWRDRDLARMGIWLMLGAFAKPFVAILFLVPLIRGNWRALALGVATGILAFAASAALFGWRLVATYILENPILHEMPASVYTEGYTQSLFATILRELGASPGSDTPLTNIPFLGIAGGMALVTAALAWRSRRFDASGALAATLALALVVYPKTLEHYAVVLYAPFLWLMAARGAGAKGDPLGLVIALFLAIETALMARGSRSAFFAMALAWIVCAIAALARRTPRDGAALATP